MLLSLPTPLILACLATLISLSTSTSAAPLPSIASASPAAPVTHQYLLARPSPPHILRILDDEVDEPTTEVAQKVVAGESTIFADFLLADVAPSMVQEPVERAGTMTGSFRIPVRETGAAVMQERRGRAKGTSKRRKPMQQSRRKAKQELLQRIITISTTVVSSSTPSATLSAPSQLLVEPEALPTPPPTLIEAPEEVVAVKTDLFEPLDD